MEFYQTLGKIFQNTERSYCRIEPNLTEDCLRILAYSPKATFNDLLHFEDSFQNKLP